MAESKKPTQDRSNMEQRQYAYARKRFEVQTWL